MHVKTKVVKTYAGINLQPRSLKRNVLQPRKLHVIKTNDLFYSIKDTDRYLLAFLQYDQAHQHLDHLWRSYEATGTLDHQQMSDRSRLQLPCMKEAKPINSDGMTGLTINDMYFNDLRDICMKNIISLLIVTSISQCAHNKVTYHCHKYTLDLRYDRVAGLLDKNWTV